MTESQGGFGLDGWMGMSQTFFNNVSAFGTLLGLFSVSLMFICSFFSFSIIVSSICLGSKSIVMGMAD